MIHARGDDIVRIKGIVQTPRGRILLQSVRKVVQSPEILADEPTATDNRDGLLVLIGRRFTTGELVRSLNAFGIGGPSRSKPELRLQKPAGLVTEMDE